MICLWQEVDAASTSLDPSVASIWNASQVPLSRFAVDSLSAYDYKGSLVQWLISI